MKTAITLFALLLSATLTFAHTGVELGPNGGRILEFSTDETMHGEVSLKDGHFRIALLDKDMKPVALADQSLTATSGDRSNPQKLAITREGAQFVVPAVQPDQWIIFQFKLTPDAKPITARLHYETKICEECKAEEWLCKCASEEK